MDLNNIEAFNEHIDSIMKSNNKTRIKPIRELLKSFIIFIYENTDALPLQNLISLIFSTDNLSNIDLNESIGSSSILNHINKGLNVKYINLNEGDNLSNFTSDIPLSINKTFEVKNNEIIFIREKVKVGSDTYNYYRLWLFKKGTGVWGISDNLEVKKCYNNDFILIDEVLIGQTQINSIILGNKTINDWLNYSTNYNIDSILTWLYNLQNYKADLVNGKIPIEQLPFGDDVLIFPNLSSFPVIGLIGKLYIDEAEDKTYIWDNNSSSYKETGIDSTWKSLVDSTLILLNNSKLNKPTTTGNTTTHPFVVGEDGNGNSARLPAGDLGKNFFNSDLNNTTARNHTMNAGIAVNTLGNPHTLSGLPNKNTDIANFRKIRVQNVTGLDAVIDSKNLAIDIPNVLSEAEKTAWKTAMNGGWATNTMSVAVITSPVVDKQDKNHWLTLKGANLNLNPANFSIEIMDSTGVNVVATIPNSQIQLYISGLDLTLYYNFKDLPIGTYRFRLNNGTATYTTGANVSLTVVQLLQYQDLSATSWSKKLWNNNTTSTLSSGSGNSAVYIPDPSVKSLANDGSFVCALLSQQIIPENQDFQIEFTISITSNRGGKLASYIAGLVPSTSSVELTNQTNFGVSLKSNDAALRVEYFRDNDISVWISTNTNQNSATFKVIATRRGGSITSLYQGLTSIAFAQKSYTNSALKIGLYTQNTAIGDLNVGLNINSLVFF